MKKILTIFLILIIFILGVRSGSFLLQSLDWPLSYCVDMVLMKFFAWSLDRGLWPYTDIHTYNLPMTIYINWIALKVFGNSSWAFRLLDVTWLIFLGGITFIYLRKKTTLIAFLGFSLCLTLSENATNFGAFQRETMMLPFWILSLISYDKIREGHSQNLHGFLLGLYICFSSLIKPTGFLLLILILIALLWEQIAKSKLSLKSFVRFHLSIFCGGLLVLFLSLLPFILHGNLSDSIQGWIEYFKDLSHSLEILSQKELLGMIFTFSPTDWFIPLNEPVAKFKTNGHFSLFHLSLISIYLFLLIKKELDLGPLFILIGGLLNYLIQAKGFAYHLFLIWFACLLIITYILDFFYKKTLTYSKWKRILPIFIIIIIGLTLVIQQTRSQKFYKGTGLYDGFSNKKKVFKNLKVLEAIKEIKAEIKTQPAKIQIFEAYHSITLNSVMDDEMDLISKFPEGYIFYNESPAMDKYKIEMIKNLQDNQPDIIVLNREGTFQTKKDLLKSFPELEIFLKNYILEKEILEINNVKYYIYIPEQAKKALKD